MFSIKDYISQAITNATTYVSDSISNTPRHVSERISQLWGFCTQLMTELEEWNERSRAETRRQIQLLDQRNEQIRERIRISEQVIQERQTELALLQQQRQMLSLQQRMGELVNRGNSSL